MYKKRVKYYDLSHKITYIFKNVMLNILNNNLAKKILIIKIMIFNSYIKNYINNFIIKDLLFSKLYMYSIMFKKIENFNFLSLFICPSK